MGSEIKGRTDDKQEHIPITQRLADESKWPSVKHDRGQIQNNIASSHDDHITTSDCRAREEALRQCAKE